MEWRPALSIRTTKDLCKRVKSALIYVSIFILFRTAFILIVPYYTNPLSRMDGPIDAKFFDIEYVKKAKNEGYSAEAYFEIYLPLDIAFPIFYTIMFLTIVNAYRLKQLYYGAYKKLHHIFVALVFAGMGLDLLENGLFSLYMVTPLNLATLIAFITTIKIFFFLINLAGFLAGLIMVSLIVWRNRNVGLDRPNKTILPQADH